MAFLDNSGDIILDAVLTDTGRLRLAQGDGSFKITKFALGDDEINYANYDKNHASGSAYYDLTVLQTPVLEAFTNNTSNLKTKLVTMSRTNVLYMPILKLNKVDKGINTSADQVYDSKTFFRPGKTPVGAGAATLTNGDDVADSKFYVAADKDTYDILTTFDNGTIVPNLLAADKVFGVIQGYTAADNEKGGSVIRVDHGLDTNEVSPGIGLDSDMQETAFIVEVDYRFGRVKHPENSDAVTPVNFIDDDNVATYYVAGTPYVNPQGAPALTNVKPDPSIAKMDELKNPQVFAGPRGNTLQFRIQASQELQQSTYLYTQIGTSEAADSSNTFGINTTDSRCSGKKIYYLDTTVRITGANTGYRLDVPVRFVRITT